MNTSTLLKRLVICSIIGAVFCAYQNSWFILCFPLNKHEAPPTGIMTTSSRKKVTLIWWHKNKWYKEVTEIIWPTATHSAVESLVQSWLKLLDEEKNNKNKKVALETALLSTGDKTAYLSFDRTPFDINYSMYDKITWFEGLCSTLKKNGLPCTHIQLLVHHKPLTDPHLDCTHPWPISGFMHKN